MEPENKELLGYPPRESRDMQKHSPIGMDKTDRKTKNRRPSKSKSTKKRTTDGPSCSMFLVDLSKKLAQKKREEENSPKNIVQRIVDSITNALPILFTKKSPEINPPLAIEDVQSHAPELLPNQEGPNSIPELDFLDVPVQEVRKRTIRMPKMPVTNSDVFKHSPYTHVPTEDAAVNTSSNLDAATNIARCVDTLKKISLIAEEFNQKTAKNLKDIVDSVQEDLKIKLKELENEQRLSQPKQPMEIEYQMEKAGSSK